MSKNLKKKVCMQKTQVDGKSAIANTILVLTVAVKKGNAFKFYLDLKSKTKSKPKTGNNAVQL